MTVVTAIMISLTACYLIYNKKDYSDDRWEIWCINESKNSMLKVLVVVVPPVRSLFQMLTKILMPNLSFGCCMYVCMYCMLTSCYVKMSFGCYVCTHKFKMRFCTWHCMFWVLFATKFLCPNEFGVLYATKFLCPNEFEVLYANQVLMSKWVWGVVCNQVLMSKWVWGVVATKFLCPNEFGVLYTTNFLCPNEFWVLYATKFLCPNEFGVL